MSTILTSKKIAVTTEYAVHVLANPLMGIQNNTVGTLKVKFNAGDGEFEIPAGALYEPTHSLSSSLTLKSSSAGDCVVLF